MTIFRTDLSSVRGDVVVRVAHVRASKLRPLMLVVVVADVLLHQVEAGREEGAA